MKHRYIVLLILLVGSSCKKLEIVSPEFDVQLVKLTYKVDDTVKFNITGNVENIAFYSGEEGFRYDNRDTPTYKKGIPKVQFNTTMTGTAQANSLRILATNKLVGRDAAGIASTNWTDITNRFTLATSATSRASGLADLNEFMEDRASFVLAFKYVAALRPTAVQPVWTITAFVINGVYDDGTTVPVTNLAVTPWEVFDIKNPVASWTYTPTQLRMNGGPANSPDNEDWILTQDLNLNTIKAYRERSVPIQSMTGRRLSQYAYIYKSLGIYRVALVGFNSNVNGTKQVVREFEITVLD